MNIYHDGGTVYLELHAMRAPVGCYLPEFAGNPDAYDSVCGISLLEFEQDHDVTIYLLGRSGRHVCIADTPDNRARYDELQADAIARTKAMWAMMREPDSSLGPAE